ncbi:MAG: hypothetical protein GC196_13275 [Hyphomonas sp.]|nr:hypothetical protein [Hyphomonas sp.]
MQRGSETDPKMPLTDTRIPGLKPDNRPKRYSNGYRLYVDRPRVSACCICLAASLTRRFSQALEPLDLLIAVSRCLAERHLRACAAVCTIN